MTNELNRSAQKYQKQHHRRSIWHRVISILSAVTVFITTYALILPAITMEPSPGIKLDRQFTVETDELVMRFDVEGRATFKNQADEQDFLSPKKLNLTVTPLEVESSVYAQYTQYAQENIGDSSIRELMTMRLNFTYDGAPLDMSGCTIEAEITVKDQLLQDAVQDPVKDFYLTGTQQGGAEEVMALTAFQGVSHDLTTQDTAFLPKGERGLTLTTRILGDTMAIVLYSAVNPSFTVQYYTYFTVLDTTNKSGYVAIDVIDTTGGVLPKNGVTPSTKDVYLKKDGSSNRYVMATKLQLAPLYNARTFEYVKAPSTMYMDRLRDNANYELNEIWVLKSGKSATSTNKADWNIYPGTASFTNRAESASSTRIYLSDGAVIRFVYEEEAGSFTDDVNFYDYDITDGKIYNSKGTASTTDKQTNGVWYAKTYKKGINSFNVASGTVAFAYGNVNTGSGYGDATWNGNQLNAYNRSGGGFDGCTFGMVTGFNTDGTLKFAKGITAPKMFGDAAQTGKTKITGKSLQFNRVGDTYVLTSVNGTSTTGLQYFNNPTYENASGNTVLHSHIYTNNFWPMDSANTYGAKGHDLKFGSAKLIDNRRSYNSDISQYRTFPVGDDGKDHNSYFGMNFEVKFSLTEDYVGPLDYMFYGDDDMWVFLDGKLICDIGGVHSSVGCYVNLWDYLDKGSAGDHTLTFYYTERGASGSTCYMQFTLPSVDTTAPQVETNTLEVGKKVINSDTTEEFEFILSLTDKDGNPFVDDYSYTRFDKNGTAIENGIISPGENVLKLRGGEKFTIDYLPEGTRFTVTETAAAGFHTVYSINGSTNTEGNTASGSITSDVSVLFTNTTGTELPSTGGAGVFLFFLPLILGIAYCVSMPLLERLWNKRKSPNM